MNPFRCAHARLTSLDCARLRAPAQPVRRTLGAATIAVAALLGSACGDGGSAEENGDGPDSENDGSADPGELVALEGGSREHDGVLNLVDPVAAAELDAYLLSPGTSGLTGPTNRFLQFYEEDYDFLFFFTDHQVDAPLAAAFTAINKPAAPGGDGGAVEIREPGYRSTGRLKGAIGVNGQGGPLAHELMHYWGNDLDARFGFGRGLQEDFGPHWGYSGVHGQLGGFDASTLRCVDPLGAVPPSCNEVAPGRFEVTVGFFAPHVNNTQPYAPLELYLMGLAPKEEVAPITVLDDVIELGPEGDGFLLEAGGVHEVTVSDIIAVHGEKALLPEDERAFRTAFILVSAEPAAEEMMVTLADYAKRFGDADPEALFGFGKFTGGRATMDTKLSTRRRVSSPVPEPRTAFSCDPVAQDCAGQGAACYVTARVMCAVAGDAGENEPCTSSLSCAKGLDCIAPDSQPEARVCRPFCDVKNAESDAACSKMCPDTAAIFVDANRDPLGALCLP